MANDCTLRLRFNFRENCWQIWNYLSNNSRRLEDRTWRWFSLTPVMARTYAAARVPVSVEDTVV